ncbi:Myosin type-2 heavy chain 1, partial [Chytriomyces hyalinus]
CGVLETIKISNEGFPSKLTYEEFAEGYFILINSDFWESKDKRDVCRRIIGPHIDPSKYRFGNTKIFFKSGQIAFFDARRRERVIFLMNYGQKNIRRFLQRTKYKQTLVAISNMQMHAQRYFAEKKLAKLRHEAAVRKAEEERKRVLAEQEAARRQNAVVLLQSCVRRRNAVNTRQKLKQDVKNAEKNAERFKEKASNLESKVVSLAAESAAKRSEIQGLLEKTTLLSDQLQHSTTALVAAQTRIHALELELESLKKENHQLQAGRHFIAGPLESVQAGASMVKSPSRATRRTDRAPSMARSNSIAAREHHSDLQALRAENDSLKLMLESKNGANAPLPGPVGMKRVPTMTRGKSVYSGDIMELAEREKQKNHAAEAGSSTTLHPSIQQRTSSMSDSAKAQAHRVELLEREDVMTAICEALIYTVQIPLPAEGKPLVKRDVHFAAHILGSFFAEELELGMTVELHYLCFDIVEKTDLIEPYLTTLKTEVIPLAAAAVLETQEVEDFRIRDVKTAWFGGAAVSGTPNDGLSKLNAFLVEIGGALRTYMVEKSIYQRIMMELLQTVGMTSFNELLQRKGFLSPNRAIQIDNNIHTIAGWYSFAGLEAAPALAHLREAVKIAVLRKSTTADLQAVYSVATQLNANQVHQLLNVCYSPSPAPDDVSLPVSLEFREVVRSHAIASKATDILSLEPMDQNYQPLKVANVTLIDKYWHPA